LEERQLVATSLEFFFKRNMAVGSEMSESKFGCKCRDTYKFRQTCDILIWAEVAQKIKGNDMMDSCDMILMILRMVFVRFESELP
jgi:hypothetical protein